MVKYRVMKNAAVKPTSHKKNRTYHNVTPEQETKVLELVAQGKTYREASKATGIKSSGTISTILERNQKLFRKKKDKFIKLLEKNGADDKKIAEVLASLLQACKGDNPDNATRLATARYINELKGRVTDSSKRAIGVRGQGIEVVVTEY